MKRRRIVILAHESAARRANRYLVDAYAEVWREDGHEVVTLHGLDRWVDGDLVIVHVDLSVVPDEYLEFAHRYPVVLNGRARDIRKRSFSQQLVRPGNGWRGQVIVKSDLNYGGLPERLAGTRTRSWFKSPMHYRICHVDEVPEPLFDHPDIVVERFTPELEDGLYHVRAMVFLGGHVSCTRMGARRPVVNGSTQVRVQNIPPDPAILARREALGFDYGKFDYVMWQGEPLLLDINKTVGPPPKTSDPEVIAERRRRAEALYAYFPEAESR